MANLKSAKKTAKQSEERRKRNLARRTAIKTAAKKVTVAAEAGASREEIQNLLKDVAAKLYRARGKGIMHRNTAARKLSRLAKKASATARKKA